MEENKEMLELLKKIEKNSRAQAWTNKLMCAFALVAAVSCVAVLVTVSRILPQLEAMGRLRRHVVFRCGQHVCRIVCGR